MKKICCVRNCQTPSTEGVNASNVQRHEIDNLTSTPGIDTAKVDFKGKLGNYFPICNNAHKEYVKSLIDSV